MFTRDGNKGKGKGLLVTDRTQDHSGRLGRSYIAAWARLGVEATLNPNSVRLSHGPHLAHLIPADVYDPPTSLSKYRHPTFLGK